MFSTLLPPTSNTHTHTHTHTHTCARARARASFIHTHIKHIHTRAFARTHARTHTHTHTHTRILNALVHSRTHANTHIQTHTHTHTYTHALARAYHNTTLHYILLLYPTLHYTVCVLRSYTTPTRSAMRFRHLHKPCHVYCYSPHDKFACYIKKKNSASVDRLQVYWGSFSP